MNKSVLVFKSSPRSQSNSSLLADQLIAGARNLGAIVEEINLHNLDIRPCDACDTCLETGGVCVLQDDMQPLYPKLRAADAIVIASPIYWFNFSAQAKLFFDRWYALGSPDGYPFTGKRFGLLLSYADADPYISGAVNAIRVFQDMMSYLKADLVGVVYGTADKPGDMLGQENLLGKAFELGEKLA